jgi:hypothetical protein
MKAVLSLAILTPLGLIAAFGWLTTVVGVLSLFSGGWTPTSPNSFMVWGLFSVVVSLLFGWGLRSALLRRREPHVHKA